jgi:hypothetical protein
VTYLEQLAAAARPIDDDDYGSVRQTNAENDFFATLDQHLAGRLTPAETDNFDAFCLKATAVERIDEGLRLAGIAASRQ